MELRLVLGEGVSGSGAGCHQNGGTPKRGFGGTPIIPACPE